MDQPVHVRHAAGVTHAVSARHVKLAVLVVALTAAVPALGQSPNAPPVALAPLIDAFGSFSARDLEDVARGDVAVVTLHGTDRDEVALMALMSVSVPRTFYATHASEGPAAEHGGVVREPATPADFDGVSFSDAELKGLKKCRPLHCGIKLPAGDMPPVARAAEAKSNQVVDSIVRRWLADRVNDYRARGDSALPRYDDTRLDERSAEGFRRLLDESAPFTRDVRGLAEFLRGPPGASVPGIASAIHWTVDRPEGLTPIVSLVQRTTCIAADPRLPALMIAKQLYATHYFDARLDMTALAEGAGETPDTYALVVRRVRFDKLPSGGVFDLRGRVVRKLRNALREELAATKRYVEAAYERSGSASSHGLR